MIKITKLNNTKHYFVQTEIKTKYKQYNNINRIEETKFNRGIITQYYKNGVFKIICNHKIKEDDVLARETNKISFSDEILRVINDYLVVVSVDASVKRQYMGSCWVISDKTNEIKEAEEIWSNEWTNNTNLAAEAIGLYNLVKAINIKIRSIPEGAVDIYSDYEKVVNRINEVLARGMVKATEEVKDRAVSISTIVKLIKKMKIGIFIYHTDGYPKGPATFQKYSGRYLIRKRNKLAKEARVKARHFESVKIDHIPDNILVINKVIYNRSVGEIVRVIDAQATK